jgi:hypothetical protein
VSQNGVAGADVEEELRNTVAEQVVLSVELALFRGAGTGDDFAFFLAVDLLWGEAVEVTQRFGKQGLQVSEGLLVVVILGNFYTGQTRANATGKVGGDLHLAGQGEHIREQTCLQQGIGFDVLGSGVRFSFVQYFTQAGEHLLEHGHRGGIQGNGHGGLRLNVPVSIAISRCTTALSCADFMPFAAMAVGREKTAGVQVSVVGADTIFNALVRYTVMTSLASLAPGAARAPYQNNSTPVRDAVDAQQTLANRLAERLGLSPGELSAKADDYSPAKVAERILGFVGGHLARAAADGADSEQQSKNLQQFRKGVEKGFADARKILDGLGVLNGQVAANVDDTYQRIQQGLSALDQQYVAPPATGGESKAVAAYSERFAAQAQRFDLQVTTREGDKLRISVAQASASYAQASVAEGSSANGNARVSQYSSQSSTLQIGGFQVSVEGQLNDDERAALSKLFSQVRELSDKFFAGDLQGAFDQALKLELDGGQLASMSLNLSQASISQASDAYSAVAEQGGQPARAVNSSLIDYAKGLMQALQTSNQASNDGRSTLEQLLQGSFALDERFDSARLDRAGTFNQRLLDGLQTLLAPTVETPLGA